MKFGVSDYNKQSFKSMFVSHGEELLDFSAGTYTTTRGMRRSDSPEDDVLFFEANEFVSRLKRKEQEALFDLYARLESYYKDFDYNDATEDRSVFEYLADITQGIFAIIKYDELHNYVQSNTQMKIPADVYTSYKTDDKITQSYKDKTYLAHDYIHLMAWVLGQRFMIPIWGMYTRILDKTEGSAMKDYTAFRLLQGTCMWECEAFNRAEIYVHANMDKGSKNLAAMLNFLTSEEIPQYLMAITSMRKLSIAPLSYKVGEDDGHMMKLLHNYSTNQFKQMDEKIQSDIHVKKNNHEFADDNTSVFGQFKMKEHISIGDLEINQQYVSRYLKAARKIEADVNDDHTDACVAAALDLKDYRPSETQRGLAAWITSYIVPSVVVPMFDRQHLMTCMGIAQSVLWAWGYHELAILVTAKPIHMDDNEMRSRMGRTHLSKELVEQLNVIYPWTLQPNNHIPGGDSPNVGIRGIELIAQGFGAREWEPTCPRALAKLHENSHLSRRIDPSHNLRDQLANLLIRLDSQI